jgi:hypothetical protein
LLGSAERDEQSNCAAKLPVAEMEVEIRKGAALFASFRVPHLMHGVRWHEVSGRVISVPSSVYEVPEDV